MFKFYKNAGFFVLFIENELRTTKTRLDFVNHKKNSFWKISVEELLVKKKII